MVYRGNHKLVFKTAGFTSVNDYTYYDKVNNRVNIDQLIADLSAAPAKSVVILHGCAHNPTGMDPTHDEWKRIAEVVKVLFLKVVVTSIIQSRNLFTFFDIAYQGFASGDPDADAWAIRYFVEQGIECVIAQSFAKNFGLYSRYLFCSLKVLFR